MTFQTCGANRIEGVSTATQIKEAVVQQCLDRNLPSANIGVPRTHLRVNFIFDIEK